MDRLRRALADELQERNEQTVAAESGQLDPSSLMVCLDRCRIQLVESFATSSNAVLGTGKFRR